MVCELKATKRISREKIALLLKSQKLKETQNSVKDGVFK